MTTGMLYFLLYSLDSQEGQSYNFIASMTEVREKLEIKGARGEKNDSRPS